MDIAHRSRRITVNGGNATDNQSDRLQSLIAKAARWSVDRDGPWVVIDMEGRALGVGTTIPIVSQHKIKFINGKLVALAGLGTDPMWSVGDGVSGHRPYFITFVNVKLECNHQSAGILFNDSYGHQIRNVDIHGQVGYGLRTQTNSGAGIFDGVNIRQYWSGETGWNVDANRTALGFDIQCADDILVNSSASYCATPLKVSADGMVQVLGCHFFNGGGSAADPLLVDSTIAAPRQFVGCYFDNGMLQFTDGFEASITGSYFLKTGSGTQTSAINLITSAASADASGMTMTGNLFTYGSLANGVVRHSTTGSGSWVTTPKYTFTGNTRNTGATLGSIGTKLPYGPLTLQRDWFEISATISTPAAPSAGGRLYYDTSGGKTRLMVIFPTGAAQLVATEP
jgi:hypothetical protein